MEKKVKSKSETFPSCLQRQQDILGETNDQIGPLKNNFFLSKVNWRRSSSWLKKANVEKVDLLKWTSSHSEKIQLDRIDPGHNAPTSCRDSNFQKHEHYFTTRTHIHMPTLTQTHTDIYINSVVIQSSLNDLIKSLRRSGTSGQWIFFCFLFF